MVGKEVKDEYHDEGRKCKWLCGTLGFFYIWLRSSRASEKSLKGSGIFGRRVLLFLLFVELGEDENWQNGMDIIALSSYEESRKDNALSQS